jgi:tyrosine-protein kinase Etk/Wzc
LNQERTLLEGFIHYASILWKHRRLIVGLTGVAAVGVIAFCVASIFLPSQKSPLPNRYTASAIILVQRGAENDLSMAIRSALGIVTAPMDAQAGFDTGAFLLMILQSRTILDKMIEEFKMVEKYRVSNKAKSQLRKIVLANLRLDNNRTTGAITISYTDIDPVFATNITNRMVTMLSEWYSQNIGSATQRQKQLLDEKIADVNAQIDTLENRQNELQKKYGVLTAQDLGASQASALAALRAQLILKEIDIKNQSTYYAADDPKLKQLQEERQTIADSINRMQRGMTATVDSTSSPASLPDVQTEFNNLTVELDVQRKIVNTLSHQQEVMKLTSYTEPPFQVMEMAEVPDTKSGPQRVRIIEEVVAIAFIASVILAFVLNGVSQIREARKKKAIPRKIG